MRVLCLLVVWALAACARQPTPADVSRRLTDGIRKADQGQPREAVADFTAVLNADPKNGLAYTHRGLARSALGDTAGAAADFAAATRGLIVVFTARFRRLGLLLTRRTLSECFSRLL